MSGGQDPRKPQDLRPWYTYGRTWYNVQSACIEMDSNEPYLQNASDIGFRPMH